jgi:hypothetical protein
MDLGSSGLVKGFTMMESRRTQRFIPLKGDRVVGSYVEEYNMQRRGLE